jgi:MFS family permease
MQTNTAPRSWIFWLSLAQMISWGSTIYWFPLVMPEVERSLGLTRAQSSLGISLALISEGICGFFVGRQIDRGRARIIMTLGSLWVGLSLCLHSLVTTVTQFYIVWCCIGAGLSTVLYTPLFAVATRRYPDSFRRAIITITFLGGLASTVFIPLSAWLVQFWGWQNTCLVLGGFHLLVCLPIHWLLLRGEPKTAISNLSNNTLIDNNTASTESSTTATLASSLPPAIPLATLLYSKPFIALSLFMVLGLSISAAIPPHLISLLRERGLSEAWAIGIPAMIGMLQVLGRVVILWMDGKLNEHQVNRWIVLLMPIAIGFLLIPVTSPTIALIFACVFGIANGSMTIVKGTAIARYVNRENVAALNGILSLPIAIGRAAAPLILGLLWMPGIGYQWGVIFMFAASCFGFAAFVVAQRYSLIKHRL